MEFLASQGFDTFSMDHQGYGYSPQPYMDNPCNLSAEDQASIDAAATANCRADYQRQLTSSQTDWDEIDTVVDYLRELRGVDKVSIIGWSLGGIRTGGYAANHGEKLDKLVLFAPVYRQGSAAIALSNFPVEAAPLSLQTKGLDRIDAYVSKRSFSGMPLPPGTPRTVRTKVSLDILERTLG